MTDKHEHDPAMADAIARANESRAQILRSKASADPAYKKLADAADKEARAYSRKLAGLPDEAEPDPEGTGPGLADSEGNFARDSGQANEGGIGVKASNTEGKSAEAAIPDGWRDLSWQQRRSLASQVSEKPIANSEEANAAIEAELKRRVGE